MKKFICILLAFVMLFSFAACGKEKENSTVNGVSVSSDEKDTKKTVKVSFPLSYLSEEESADLDAYCKSYGFKSAKVNSDGTVTIKMSQLSRDLLLTKVSSQSIKEIYSAAESGKYPYVRKIKSCDTENFFEVSLLVNREKFVSAETALEMKLMVAQSCLTYQIYAGIENPKVKITIIDNKTKKTIEEKEYTNEDIK